MPLVSADPVRTRLGNGDILGTRCHLDFRPCDLQNYEIMDLCCFKPLRLWCFVPLTIGNLDVKLDPKGNAKCPGSVLSFCVPRPSLPVSIILHITGSRQTIEGLKVITRLFLLLLCVLCPYVNPCPLKVPTEFSLCPICFYHQNFLFHFSFALDLNSNRNMINC